MAPAPLRAVSGRVGFATVAVAVVCATGAILTGQQAEFNAAGIAMGHVHYTVRDVAASKAFWSALGGRPLADAGDGGEALSFSDVVVRLSQGSASGGSDGAVVNHVAFRVPSFVPVEAAGLPVTRTDRFPGVGATLSPDGERIELFEDTATNLTFTPTTGPAAGILGRHTRPVGRPIAFHHIHLYLPDQAAVSAAQTWYARHFGGVPGKRSNYDAVDLPGVNFNFSVGPKPVSPTKGRVLDHIGFAVRGLDGFYARLVKAGVHFERPFGRVGATASAVLTDPWGTSIELSETLR